MGDYALKGKIRKIFFSAGEFGMVNSRVEAYEYLNTLGSLKMYMRGLRAEGKVGDILVKFLFACEKNFTVRIPERKGMYVKKA